MDGNQVEVLKEATTQFYTTGGKETFRTQQLARSGDGSGFIPQTLLEGSFSLPLLVTKR